MKKLVQVALVFLTASPAWSQSVLLSPSGTQVVTQPAGTNLNVNRFEGVRYADQFPGSDMAVQIMNAIADVGCGRVIVPAGIFVSTETILKPRCVMLEGASEAGTILIFEPDSSAGPALLVADSAPSAYYQGGVSNLTIQSWNNNWATQCVYLGDNSGGTSALGDHQTFDHVAIQNCGVGVQFGSNAFIERFSFVDINNNQTGILYPSGLTNSGENLSIVSSDIYNNLGAGMNLAGGEWNIMGTSFDYNGGTAGVGPAVTSSGAVFSCFGCHFEQDSGSIITTTGSGQESFNFSSCTFLLGPYSGTDSQLIALGGTNSHLIVVGSDFWSGHSVNYAINFTATGSSSSLWISSLNYAGGSGIASLTNPLTPWPNEHIEDLLSGQVTQGPTVINGNLTVNGYISKSGGGFKIDHPQFPDTKYLIHSFVEAPQMTNIYNGVAQLNSRGEAIVQLPSYFESLNRQYRYQLTSMGVFAPIFVSQEIKGNRFRIGGGKPGMKVSWQVTGVRHDPYALKHPIVVEEEKKPLH